LRDFFLAPAAVLGVDLVFAFAVTTFLRGRASARALAAGPGAAGAVSPLPSNGRSPSEAPTPHPVAGAAFAAWSCTRPGESMSSNDRRPCRTAVSRCRTSLSTRSDITTGSVAA